MKAGIFFTGTGPILILTSYEALDDPKLVEKLATKGIKKYIAYEVSEEKVKEKYGNHYNVILGDLHHGGKAVQGSAPILSSKQSSSVSKSWPMKPVNPLTSRWV